MEAQFSWAVSWSSRVCSWKTRPMCRRTRLASSTTSKPATLAEPAVGRARVHNTLMVVDFPAPLGPRKAKISPWATSKLTAFTATRSP
jgi:hypothetical protein